MVQTVGTGAFYGKRQLVKLGGKLVRRAGSHLVKQTVKHALKRKSKKKTKKKETHGQDISQHNDLSTRFLGTAVVAGGRPMKTLGTYKFRNQNNWVIGGAQGEQRVDFPEVMLTRNWFTQLTGGTGRFDRVSIDTNLYRMNPFVVVPATTVYPGPHSEGVADDNLYLKSAEYEMSLLSMKTVAQEVEVIWCTPRYDTNDSAQLCWSEGLQALNLTQVPAVAPLLRSTTTATSGAQLISDVGNHPLQVGSWRKAWRVLKSAKVILQPGDQRTWKVNFKFNRMVKRVEMDTRESLYLRNITVFPLIIVKAGLVGFSDNEFGASTEVSWGSTKVGVVVNSNLVLGALGQQRWSTTRVYPGTLAGSSEFQKIVDDVDEAVGVKTN